MADGQEGILPAWEDAANLHGGTWAVQLPRKAFENAIDMIWLDVVSKTGCNGLSKTALAGIRMRVRPRTCDRWI